MENNGCSGSESTKETSSDSLIAALLVVGFHHAYGPIVEYSIPPLPQQQGQQPDRLEKLDLPEEWSFLPFLALPGNNDRPFFISVFDFDNEEKIYTTYRRRSSKRWGFQLFPSTASSRMGCSRDNAIRHIMQSTNSRQRPERKNARHDTHNRAKGGRCSRSTGDLVLIKPKSSFCLQSSSIADIWTFTAETCSYYKRLVQPERFHPTRHPTCTYAFLLHCCKYVDSFCPFRTYTPI